MTHCARLTSMRVVDDTLHLGLSSGDREIAVRADMAGPQAHALRHLHAAQRIRTAATGRDPMWDLLLDVADAAGGAITAIVVDLRGPEPAFELRVGSPFSVRGVHLDPADVVVLLSGGRVGVQVALPETPHDWDAALAELVTDEA